MSQTYPLIKSGTSDAVLAGIWRNILYDLKLDPPRLDDLILNYTKRLEKFDSQKRSQCYGNWSSDLKEEQVTWSTFLRGPRCLNVRKMMMEFTLHHRQYRSVHTLVIDYPAPEDVEPDTPDSNKGPTELSVFFVSIMYDLGVTVEKFNQLLNTFMRRQMLGTTNKSFLKGNYKKEFLNQRLSWASFIRGLEFLTIPSFDLKITLEFAGKRKRQTVHRMPIVINTIEDLLVDMDETEFLIPNVTFSTTEATQ